MGAYGEYSSMLCNFGGFKLVTNLEETKEAKCKNKYGAHEMHFIPTQNAFRSHDILLRSLKIIFRSLAIIFRCLEMKFRSHAIAFRFHAITFRFHAITSLSLEITFGFHAIVFHAHTIFRSIEIVFPF